MVAGYSEPDEGRRPRIRTTTHETIAVTIPHNPIDDPARRTIAWFDSFEAVRAVESDLEQRGIDPVHISTSARDAEELSRRAGSGIDTPGEHWIAVSGTGEDRHIARGVMSAHDPVRMVEG